jgi:hypothetical protein
LLRDLVMHGASFSVLKSIVRGDAAQAPKPSSATGLGVSGLLLSGSPNFPHHFDRCEVSVMIPFDPVHPWSGSIVSSEPNTDVETMVHIALTSLSEDCLAATVALPIALLPI